MPNATPLFTASPSPLSTSQNYTEGGSTTTGLFLSAAANVGIDDVEGSLPGQQLFQSVTLQVSNVFAGDQLRIDGFLVSVDATTSSSITAGTYKVDVTVTGGISTVVISRDPIDISSANLQTLVENIGYASTSNNPTAFGTKLTRGITIFEVKDNAGTVSPFDDLGVSPNITATVTIATVNTPVVAVNDVRTGANAAQEGSVPVLATGNALTNDVDPDSILNVTKVGSTTVASAGNTLITGTYGTLTIDAQGNYSYAANNANTVVNALNVGSPSLTDTFTYTVSDGPSSSTATIKIDIKGGNNAATISGDITRTINESIVTTAGTSVTGVLNSLDVDNTDAWNASGATTTHGLYAIDNAGAWTFTLDNANSAVNALNVGSSFVDTFTVSTIDGTTQIVSVTIQGKNDPAVIGGAKTGSIDESGVVVVSSTITGTLSATDVDSTTTWSDAGSGSSSYGTYAINAAGLWTYTLNNSSSAVNSLNGGQTLTDTFTVKTADGTTQAVAITINGKNDQATIINTSTYNLTSTGAGWYDSTGSHSFGMFSTYTGYYVGDPFNNSGEYRSFFIFDKSAVSSLTSSFIGASLFFSSQGEAFTGRAATTAFQIRSVTADLAALSAGTAGIPGFQSLNSGNLLGSYDFVSSISTPFQLSLNSSGLSYINNSATQFAFGGSIPNLTYEYIFAGGVDPVQLQLTYETSVGAVTEDALPTSLTTTGTLSIVDPDAGQAKFDTAVTSTGSNLGSLSISDAGSWSYNVSNSAVQYLGVGQTKIETFTVKSFDGTASQAVTITINGQNDAAVITAGATGFINESTTTLSGTTSTGSLTYTDVDTVDNTNTWNVGSGTTAHGSYVLSATGAWTYTLDNGNTAVNALNVGGSFVDTFTATTIDGTTQTVSVTINGQNDDAVITSSAASYKGSVTEASGLNNSINNAISNSRATGTVTFTDVDNTPFTWVATAPQVTASRQGSYSIDASGNWVYNLDNAYGTVQALQTGQSTTDTFTITTTGGTTQTVTVIITGGNDLPVVTNPAALSGSVIEAGGVANGTLNSPNATANINFTDPDNISDVWTPVTAGAATVGGFGTYGIDAFGQWTYTLDNGNSAVNALNVGGSLVDTFNVTTNDGTTQTVSVTINGTNDAAVITGSLSGTITERSGLNNLLFGSGSSNYDITGSGDGYINDNVNITDVDSSAHLANTFAGYPLPSLTASGYGRYASYSNGFNDDRWVYSLNEGNSTIQALNVGQSTTDSFTIAAVDGTTKTVNIVIQGANDEAIVSGDINNKSVTEDKGFNNSIAGTPTVTGNLTYTDVDNAGTAWIPQSSVFNGTYGIYSITNTGAWTYTVNNNNGIVDGLQAGQRLTDRFVVTTTGGTTQTVTVKILGQNDSAVITGQSSAALSESAVFTSGAATGNNLDYTDPDNIADDWVAVSTPTLTTGGHGTYTIDVHGVWNYTLATGTNIVESLALGATAIDTFVATTVDGTTKVVSITITGENDAAVITNAATAAKGSLTEAGGINNGTPGTTASNNLNATDIDNTPDTWNTVTTPTNTTLGYGQYSIASDGKWTYSANNSNSTVQALNVGTSLTDTFVATTIDGTSQIVTVTINGANDTASLTGVFTGSVTEASGVNNGTAGTGTITQNVTVTDVDNYQQLNFAVTTSTYGFYVADDNEGSPFWNYMVDDSNVAVEALNVGQTLVDTFSISAVDGTTKAVTITINGANDAASITNALTAAKGSLTEAGGLNNGTAGTTASNNLNATDVDNTADSWTVSSGTTAHGTYSIDSAGVWSYVANNSNSAVQGLNVGNSLVDTFAVTTIDGTSQTVTVTINGADDTAVISNFTGAVTEAGGTANGTAGIMTATATLSIVDPDNTYPGWTAQASTAGTYGSYALTSAGVWTYTLNNSNSATQALTAGQTVTETFTAINGGLSQTVTITVTGTNDNPYVSGEPAILTGGIENVAYTITKAQLLQGFSDVDAGQAATLSITNLTSAQGTFTLSGTTYTFVPTNPDYNGVVNLSYEVKDVSNGVYSTTSSFTITGINDAPTAALTNVSLPSVKENSFAPAGQTVASLFNNGTATSFSDAKDSPADPFLGVAITTMSASLGQGTWQWQDSVGAWQAINAVSTSSALFLQANTQIRFVPGANFSGTPGSIEARLVEADDVSTPTFLYGEPAPASGTVINVSDINSGGSKNISNISNVVTLSTTVTAAHIRNDFDGDRKADILFYDTNNDVVVWKANGLTSINPATQQFVVGNTLSSAWTVAGTGDFNGDKKSDVLFRDTNNNIAVWTLNGLAPLAQAGIIGNLGAGTWQVAGTGDFDGDNKDDILFKDASGNVAVWLGNGVNPVTSANIIGSVGVSGWQVAGTGDFTGDGKADILWRDGASGAIAIWQGDGLASVTKAAIIGTVAATSWQIEGVDNFSGDSRADILWKNTDGSVAIWQGAGLAPFTQAAIIGNVGIGSGWDIAGSGDYNGDSFGDVLFRNGNSVAVWQTNGLTPITGAQAAIIGNANSSWTIAAPII
jgi:VCBS repeat-containing protein